MLGDLVNKTILVCIFIVFTAPTALTEKLKTTQTTLFIQLRQTAQDKETIIKFILTFQ